MFSVTVKSPTVKSPSPVNLPLKQSPLSVKHESPTVQSSPTICSPIQPTFSVIEELPDKTTNPYEQCLVTPSSTLSQEFIPSSSFSSTQDAITSVKQDILSLRQSFPPPIKSSQSSNRQLVHSMGAEVRELKQEVMFLVESLQNSMRHKEILQRRLSYFEEREEDELVKQSREYERDKEMFSRRYSRKRNFSEHFNPK